MCLWATRRAYRHDTRLAGEISQLLTDLHDQFGWKSRLAAPIAGRYLFHMLRREQRRLAQGWTYEPPTFYETNQLDGPESAIPVVGVAATCRPSKPKSRYADTIANGNGVNAKEMTACVSCG